MLCQSCGKNEATTHIKQIINGEMSESHLCAACSGNMGYDDMIDSFGFSVSRLLGGVPRSPARQKQMENAVHCKTCGATFDEIMQTGKVGCSDCYACFADSLMPIIKKIHGKTAHIVKEADGGRVTDGKQHKNMEGDE